MPHNCPAENCQSKEGKAEFGHSELPQCKTNNCTATSVGVWASSLVITVMHVRSGTPYRLIVLKVCMSGLVLVQKFVKNYCYS